MADATTQPANAATTSAPSPGPTVAIARDAKCLRLPAGLDAAVVARMLDAALVALTGRPDPKAAWAALFKPEDRVAVKVNTLGHHTHPVVATVIADKLRAAGLPAGNICIWDRTTEELRQAGFQIATEAGAVQCLGTDALRGGAAGYEGDVVTSGAIGSRYSLIVSRWATGLINVPVLKDHSLCGLSGGLKNFYGAIHNPNKYHDNNCDPFAADVSLHPWISRKLRLVVVDATYAQYNGGPGKRPDSLWPLGALLAGTDPVAVDATAWRMLDRQRLAKGLKDLAADGRPAKHILTAEQRGLGVADEKKIRLVEV